jgi:L-alanine-DL-glutamate epimerase-like enolase superfamily enzyme
LAEPPEIRDGRRAPRPLPGLGIEVDEDRLEHYRIDR